MSCIGKSLDFRSAGRNLAGKAKQQRKTNMIETCPKCGGTAILLQMRDDFEVIPDITSPTGKVRLPVKVEEFRCQEQSCEHEFERIIREPTP